jgi:hypothetical protein
MKKLVLCLLCLAVPASLLYAQKIIEKTLPYSANQKIELELKIAENIRITTWDKNEFYIKASVEINGGKLNDALLVKFDSNKDHILVTADFDKEMLKKGEPGDCPEDGNHYSYGNDNTTVTKDGKVIRRGNYVCSNINYEVFIPKQANLRVESISADIDIKGTVGPVYAKTISGFVDMNWPEAKGANVLMKSISGEVYSDLNIDFRNKQKHPIVGYSLEGTLNGGGTEVHLETISNNVYLRRRN